MVDVTGVLGVLGTLATGGAVSLGPITFTGFEVPSRINFGGSQRLVVHRFPGGARVIDSLGDDPARPEWKGSFTGPLAAARARAGQRAAAGGPAGAAQLRAVHRAGGGPALFRQL